jgi:hypothetical protein
MIKYLSLGLIGVAGTVIAALAIALAALAVFVGLRAVWLLAWDALRARTGHATYSTAFEAAEREKSEK